LKGFDYSAGPIPPQSLKDFGALVALRYVTPGYPGKTLTKDEVDGLIAGGISVVALWETTADRMLGGQAAGQEDGAEAEKAMTLLGFPNDSRCYFSADWDVQPDQVNRCLDYLGAAAAQMGGRELTGCYGGLRVVQAAGDAQYATIQTDAWSAGQWDARAVARQTGEQITVAGVKVDVNEIVNFAELGAWSGGPDVSPQTGTIPESIVQRWGFLSIDFPPGSTFELMNALIWADAGARAAAIYAERAAGTAGLANSAAQSALAAAQNAATSASQAVDLAKSILSQVQANGTALSSVLAKLNTIAPAPAAGVPAPAAPADVDQPAS
jgi:hypothetical protein